MNSDEKAVSLHRKLKGKIRIESLPKIKTAEELSLVYTPGVAAVCRKIKEDSEEVYELTSKGNNVAIVTDGSAVLGLGNIGAEASLPVMEGKALLFHQFAGINAYPIALKSQNAKEIISLVKNISPSFAGINLEDIASPRCFEIEEALQEIGIPVFHDDQHGTAVVVLAGLINASKVVGKKLEEMKIVVIGAGAAGTAITRMLLCIGFDKKICSPVKKIIVLDVHGTLYKGRKNMNKWQKEIALKTNLEKIKGGIAETLKGADAVIGVSTGNILTKEMIKGMNKDAIVFAMANPIPEIMPAEALKAGAKVVGTGRSDFPNQINNSLAFPGIFRGALDAKAMKINNSMKMSAAYALAGCVKNPSEKSILPTSLDKKFTYEIAKAVRKTAIETGVSRESCTKT